MADTVLTINNINKSYGDNLILNGLSLDVHKGEVIVIIGPSGCGKSTLLRCINALEPIQGGEIRLDGELIDGNSRNIAQIRQKIGMGSAAKTRSLRKPNSFWSASDCLIKRIVIRVSSPAVRSSASRSSARCVCILKSCYLTR